MSMSSEVPQSSFVSDTNAPPASTPALSQPATTQIIPGTTVIGTGTTGDVWSYTIPPITSVIVPSASAALPPPSSPAPTSAPEASGTYVVSQIVLSGTTVVGGTETGVPWSYTIPGQSIVTSVFVPITISPTATPTESLPLTNSLTPATESPIPTHHPLPGYTEPVPRPLPDESHTTLSGGIVAAILGGLLFLMFVIAGCLCFRLRKRQREGGGDRERGKTEKDVGVVWGRPWGSEDKGVGAWRKRPRMNNQEGEGDGYARSGGSEVMAPASALLGPAARFRQDHLANTTPPNESAERLIERPSREGGPLLYPSNTRPNTTPSTAGNPRYLVTAGYPQTHGSVKIPDIDTRAPLSQRNVNTNANDDTNNMEPTRSKSPTAKLKRPMPPPSPHVYAPPPEELRESSTKVSYSASPFSTRPTSPYRAASPYGSQNSLSQGRKVLSKQKQRVLPPSTSAFMRHMLPTRTMSLRRPKAPPSAPSSSTDAPAPTRPGLATLPSFIRDRRFSPGPSRNGSKSTSQGEGESVIFSPSTRASQLPHHAPTRINSPMLRTPASLVQPRLPTSRDRYLSPPAYGRDRSSQLTSTTRSGSTGWSKDTRSTGRSGASAATGRSGDSRMTGRSGRAGALAQIPESDREPGAAARRGYERSRSPRRHERP